MNKRISAQTLLFFLLLMPLMPAQQSTPRRAAKQTRDFEGLPPKVTAQPEVVAPAPAKAAFIPDPAFAPKKPPVVAPQAAVPPAAETREKILANELSSDVSISAKSVARGKSLVTRWATSWGSYNRDYEHSSDIQVDIRSTAMELQAVRVEAAWIGKDAATGQRFVYGGLSKELAISNKGMSFKAGSMVASSDDRYVALGARYMSGGRPEGWVVRLLNAKGAVIGTAASLEHLKDIAAKGFLEAKTNLND